jgi:hypothetical protein
MTVRLLLPRCTRRSIVGTTAGAYYFMALYFMALGYTLAP